MVDSSHGNIEGGQNSVSCFKLLGTYISRVSVIMGSTNSTTGIHLISGHFVHALTVYYVHVFVLHIHVHVGA